MFISIGHFCDPAANLKMLGLREYSFPFDWLYMHNECAFWYVNHLIETDFIHFTEKPVYDIKQKVVSSYYPDVEFYHQDLITNIVLPDQHKYPQTCSFTYHENLVDTMMRRATRFMKFITNKEENIVFICTIQYNAFIKNTKIYDEMLQFSKNKKIQCKYKVLVLLYENVDYEYRLPDKYLQLDNFIFQKYVRDCSKHLTYGNPEDFHKILLNSNLKV